MQSETLRSAERFDFDFDELVSWLEIMAGQELDLAPPLGEKKRRHRLKSIVYITLHGEIEHNRKEDNITLAGRHDDLTKPNQNGIDGLNEISTWGYAELVRLGNLIEFAGVIIDPNRRGRGHSHHLIERAIERWRQDAILHRTNPPLSVANRLGLFCYTRHVGLSKALLKAGFEQRPAVRHWSRLWLVRSAVAPLPFLTQFSLISNRLFRVIKTFFSEPKRVIHQAKHLSNYQLYTFDDTNASSK